MIHTEQIFHFINSNQTKSERFFSTGPVFMGLREVRVIVWWRGGERSEISVSFGAIFAQNSVSVPLNRSCVTASDKIRWGRGAARIKWCERDSRTAQCGPCPPLRHQLLVSLQTNEEGFDSEQTSVKDRGQSSSDCRDSDEWLLFLSPSLKKKGEMKTATRQISEGLTFMGGRIKFPLEKLGSHVKIQGVFA